MTDRPDSASSPTVSVVMGVYNSEEYVARAVESVLDQTFTDFEFIVVDDGSTDGTRDVLASFDDDRLRILENEENVGLTRSLNEALDRARGTYYARQDADDVSRPDRLERQVAFLDRHPDVAMVGTGAWLTDADGARVERRIPLAAPSYDDVYAKNRFVHGSVMLRTRVLESLGGYDERFEFVQDYDLWLRLTEEYAARNLTAPLYELRLHGDSIFISKQRESALYELLARRLADDALSEAARERIDADGIAAFEDFLDDAERAGFHASLATTFLRYGDPGTARRESVNALRYDPTAVSPYLAYALSYAGETPRSLVAAGMRTALNAVICARNAAGRWD